MRYIAMFAGVAASAAGGIWATGVAKGTHEAKIENATVVQETKEKATTDLQSVRDSEQDKRLNRLETAVDKMVESNTKLAQSVGELVGQMRVICERRQ